MRVSALTFSALLTGFVIVQDYEPIVSVFT